MDQRIYFDMDGVLAKWQNVPMDEIMTPGYFRSLNPDITMCACAKKLIADGYEVCIASKAMNQTAANEKREWLNYYIPEMKKENIYLIPYEAPRKTDGINERVKSCDILLDDNNHYGLSDWPGVGIKVLNGINNSHRSWNGYLISTQQDPDIITKTVEMIAKFEKERA